MAAAFVTETSGSEPGGPQCPGDPGRDSGCLKLNVLNPEKPHIFTRDRAAIFRAKILNAFAFLKEV